MIKKFLSFCTIFILLSGCAVNPPFNNRVDYLELGSMKSQESKIADLNIIWEPSDFNEYIEIKGSSGFIGRGSRTRIPTGVAISSRLNEALDQALTVSSSSKNELKIKVSKAVSNFKFSGTSEGGIDYGEVILDAKFTYKNQTWSKSFYHEEDDPRVAATGAVKPLEIAWDKVAIQMATSIITNINRIENELN